MNINNVGLIVSLLVALIGVFILVVVAVNRDHERSVMAEQYGCTYLGTARDLIGVTFYNCNGEIVMRPSGKDL